MPRSLPRDEGSDRGATLIEVLVALVIIGITASAGLTALMTSISRSTEHRQLGALNTLVKSYAENAKQQIELGANPLFSDCASSYSISYTLPSEYAEYTVGIAPSGIQYFNSSSDSFSSSCGASATTGVQAITVLGTAPGNESQRLTFVVRNPNYPASSNPYAGF